MYAGGPDSQKSVILQRNQVVNNDYFASGDTVTISGTVNGDAYIAGGTVIVDGVIDGDLLVAGGIVIISGTVTNDVRAVGGDITVGGKVGRNVTIVGGSALITDTAQINGSLVASVARHTLSSREAAPKVAGDKNLSLWHRLITSFTVLSYISTLIIGLLFTWLFPSYLLKVSNTAIKKPLRSLGVGFMSVVCAPFVLILLLVSVLGIPLGVMFLALFLIAIWFAKIYISLALGQKILMLLNKKPSVNWALFAGLTIYYLLTRIPVIGPLLWVIFGLIGLGASFITKREIYKKLAHNHLI